MLEKIRRTTRNDEGASAVEYGLLVAAIAALIVVVVFALGQLVGDVFQETCQQIGSQAGPDEDPDPIDVPEECEDDGGGGTT